jgi:hypothetical protein
MAGNEENTTKPAEILYSENAKVAAIFWDWRHKVLAAFAASFSGVVFVVGWLFQTHQGKPGWWLPIPVGLGSLLAFACYRLDKANMTVLGCCYEVGRELEKRILSDSSGIFRKIAERPTQVRFSQVFSIIYKGSAILLLILAGVLALLIGCHGLFLPK